MARSGQGIRLIKTFILGLILGLAGAAALAYYSPLVNLSREASLIAVLPNGGNTESFHINLPHDRILAGARNAGQVSVLPEGVTWPDMGDLDGSQVEIFKLRNREDNVVGVATRVSSVSDSSGPFIQWMLHLPARGTVFARMGLGTTVEGVRDGLLVAGTREFEPLTGSVREYFNNDVPQDDREISGRLELETRFVGPMGSFE